MEQQVQTGGIDLDKEYYDTKTAITVLLKNFKEKTGLSVMSIDVVRAASYGVEPERIIGVQLNILL